jgi:hypothetical protein
MRLGIVGSRDFPRLDLVVEYVNGLPVGTIVVSGGAPGVDLTAEVTAEDRGLGRDIKIIMPGEHPLDRNTRIVEASDVVVAFITRCRKCPPLKCKRGGWTHGTSDTIEKAQRVNKFGWVVAL